MQVDSRDASTDLEHRSPLSAVEKAILEVLTHVPPTDEPESSDPSRRARRLAKAAALKAFVISGSLSLPPGPAGLLTILPDLITVWKTQAQMVADIGAAFGKKSSLTQEQMLYCLFRHAAAYAVRDLVVRVGERVLIRRAPLRTVQAVARKLGIHVSQRFLGRGISRWLPIVGALGVGSYVYYDTVRVAETAIELFGLDEIEFAG